MKRIYHTGFLLGICFLSSLRSTAQEQPELRLVQEVFRLRNEHKADSLEAFYADTVKVYMKYLRNIPRKIVTKSDKAFWKAHPRNKFEMTEPVQLSRQGSTVVATIYGKEYLDGTSFKYEKIELKFDRNRKIYSYRGFNWSKR